MTFRLGLTGGIGMGKTTTAAMFARRGVPVWDADSAVHRLYAPGGAAVDPVARLFPSALSEGGIDRGTLRGLLADNPTRLPALEAVVHPLVAEDRSGFIAAHTGAPVVLLDIPLLYETGAQAALDGVAVASASPDIQRQRVLARPGMTAVMLDLILSRQMADADRRAQANWIIPTDTLSGAEAGVDRVLAAIREGRPHA